VIRTFFLPALLAVAVTLSLVSSADARKRRWYIELYAPPSATYSHQLSRQSPARWLQIRSLAPDPIQHRIRTGGVGGIIARLVQDCRDEASQLKDWPFDKIAHIAALDEAQRGELENLRATTHSAAERLSAECPQASGETFARLELIEQAVDAADAAFAQVEPMLQRFYASLDDEQKARILRDLTLAGHKADDANRVPDERRERRRASRRKTTAIPAAAPPTWAGLCQDFTAALRYWPTREIEQGVQLNEPQRVALYELVTVSLKTAEKLADGCPAEAPITPVHRMAVLRVSLHAVRHAATSMKPRFAQFYGALDHGQRAKFVEMR
jgi:hypothetical protein